MTNNNLDEKYDPRILGRKKIVGGAKRVFLVLEDSHFKKSKILGIRWQSGFLI